jgi:cytosine/adenosine deaminase-related metal-dependent hydrolase
LNADLALDHGLLVTMDPQRRVFADGSLVVRDGAIIDVGPTREISKTWQVEQRVNLQHAVALPGLINTHVSDAELEVLNTSGATVAVCPAGNLHLASGISRVGRHPDMKNVAFGTDSPHGLSFLHTAGLACGLFGDMHRDRSRLLPERALEWLTLAGARAFGASQHIGSLEVGKRADVAVFDVLRPLYNVANSVVHHATTGRAIHVFIDGEHVVRDGEFRGEQAIVQDAARCGRAVLQRAGMPTRTGWYPID